MLTVGPASLSGTFTFAAGAGGVTIAASGAALSFGSYVSVSGASGSLQLSSAGVIADLAATTVSVALPGFAPTGMSATIQVNTTSAPATASDNAVIPAGPYIQAAVTVPQTPVTDPANSATVLGQLAGSFLFQQQQVAGTTTTVVGLSGVSVWIGSASSATVTNGEGLFVVSTDATHHGIAGYVSGTAAAGGTGFAAGGNVIVQFNTTGMAVNASVLVGGKQLTVDYGSGQTDFMSVSISDLTIQIGQAIWLSGNVSLTSGVTVSGLTGSTFAGSGLTVFFGNGPGLLANGDANPLAVGLLITNASVVLFQDQATGKYALDATGTVTLVGVSNATVSGTGRVRINPFAQAIDATIALPGSGTSLPLAFLSSEAPATSGGAPFVSAGGLGLNLNVFGQAITGDLSLTDANGVVTVGIANASISLSDGSGNVSSRGPPLASVTNASGQLQVSPAGVVGGLTGTVAVTLPGAAVTGTFSVLVNTTGAAPTGTINGQTIPAGNFFELTATGASIAIGGQSLTGAALTLSRTTTNGVTVTTLGVSGAALLIGDGTTTFLSLDTISGSLTVSSAGVSGSLSAHLVSSALTNLTANTISVAVNTTSSAVGGLPAGPYLRGELTGATLTVGGQSLSGDFGFQRTVDTTGATVVVAAVNNLTVALGGGVATLSQGIGAVVISGGKLAGFASGTLALNLPGVVLAGALAVQVNQTSGAVNDTFTLGGQPIVINVPSGGAGGYISVAGTGVTLTVLGQSISGDVSLTSASGTTTLTLANGSLSLAGGAVTVTGAAGGLTIGSGGITGNLAATVTTTLTGLAFSSGLQLSIDTRPGTSKLAITGTDTTLTVAGQSLSGDFSAERGTDATGAAVLKIAFSNSSSQGNLLSIGATVTVPDGSGQLIVSPAGVAGSFTVSGVSVTLPSDLTLGAASFTMAINTMAAAVTEPFTINGTTTTLTLPAGPYVSVSADGVDLTLASLGTLHGDFTFQRQGSGASAVTIIAAANVSVSALSLTNGSGAMVLTSGGVAGLLQASITTGVVTGNGNLRFNNTGGAVDQTVTVGGQPMEIQFGSSEGHLFSVAVDGLTFNVGNFVTIQGNVALGSYTLADSTPAHSFAGTSLSVFLGQGPATLASGATNPLARGILISGASVGLIQIGSGSGATYAFVASGTATVLGASGLTLTGTVTVAFNNTGKVLSETLTVPGSSDPGVAIAFPNGNNPGAVQLIGGQLGLLGQTLSGNFAFASDAAGVSIAASAISLSLGGGAVSVTGASGLLQIGTGGLAGTITGTVALSVPGVSLGGTYTIAVNTGATPVSESVTLGSQAVVLDLPGGPFLRVTGSQTSLTIAGQTLTGDFSFQRATLADGSTVTEIVAANVTTTFGGAGAGAGASASLTAGQGALIISSAGIAGTLSGNVALALPSQIALAGAFTLQVNTTTTAINQSLTAGATTVALTVPAGPFVRLEATGATLTVAGQTLTGDIAIQKASSGHAASVVQIGVANGTLSLGGALSVTAITGALFVETDQAASTPSVAGTLSATVAFNVPGVTVGGTLGVQVNSGPALNDTFILVNEHTLGDVDHLAVALGAEPQLPAVDAHASPASPASPGSTGSPTSTASPTSAEPAPRPTRAKRRLPNWRTRPAKASAGRSSASTGSPSILTAPWARPRLASEVETLKAEAINAGRWIVPLPSGSSTVGMSLGASWRMYTRSNASSAASAAAAP